MSTERFTIQHQTEDYVNAIIYYHKFFLKDKKRKDFRGHRVIGLVALFFSVIYIIDDYTYVYSYFVLALAALLIYFEEFTIWKSKKSIKKMVEMNPEKFFSVKELIFDDTGLSVIDTSTKCVNFYPYSFISHIDRCQSSLYFLSNDDLLVNFSRSIFSDKESEIEFEELLLSHDIATINRNKYDC